MPKVVKNKKEIIEYARKTNQSEAARKFGVSHRYVNMIVNNKKSKINRAYYVCPITGFKICQ